MIVVTGALGFIGSNLVHRLLRETDRPLLLVDTGFDGAKIANIAGLPRFSFLVHSELALTLPHMSVVSAVFHLGACSDTTETNWDYLYDNNVAFSQMLWRFCAERQIPFIYASSAATYGDGSRGFDDRTPPGELAPLNLYGQSKNDFDAWVLAEVAAGRPTPNGWAGLKFFNVYGPREQHKGRMASVVWKAYNEILRDGRAKLFRSSDAAYPDGGQLRDFVFVNDCINHMLWFWRNPLVRGVFNSGTGQARSFLDLVRATFAAMGREPTIDFVDMPRDLVGKYQNFTQASLEKLRTAGCDVPSTTLEDGVRQYVGWLNQTG